MPPTHDAHENLGDPRVFGGARGDVVETSIAGYPALAMRPVGTIRGQVVFLHGAFGDHTSFAPFLRAFAEAGYAGIAFARRGRAGVATGEGLDHIGIGDYLDDVRQVLDDLDGPVIVVGHSLGGLLAQHMAVEGRCEAAVLVSSPPRGMLQPQAIALPALAPSLPRIFAGLAFRPTDEAVVHIALQGLERHEQRRVLRTLGAESGKAYRSMILGTGGPKGKAQCPMLVVGGSEDRVVSVRQMRQTAADYHADLEVFDRMGHWLLELPRWRDVASRIVRWLDEKVPLVASVPAPVELAGRRRG